MSTKMKLAGLVLLVTCLTGFGVYLFLGQSRSAPSEHLAAAQPTVDADAVGTDRSALQRQIIDANLKAAPSVIKIGRGSGVIVTADGLILTQRHVVSISFPQATLGTKIAVRLATGTEEEAELLGVDPLYDLAALRLTGPGPYQYCPLADNGPRLGDGILKFGHPVGGPTEIRPPVVRFCRVLVRTDNQFVCDCLVNGGDSGGPFVDLEGRVVGLQGPLGIGPNWPTLNQRTERLMVEKLESRDHCLDTGRAAPLLHKRLPLLVGRAFVPVTDADRAVQRADNLAIETAPFLPVERWCQGEQSLNRFHTAGMSGGVVEVLGWGDGVIALGTVIDDTGLVLTTAAPAVTETAYCLDKLRCRLQGRTLAAATVVGIDPDYNLALLRIRAEGLKPVEWVSSPDLSAGTLLSAFGPNGLPLVTGVVSVAPRQVQSPRPVPTDLPFAAPLDMTIKSIPESGGFRIESCKGNSLIYGFRPNDVVISLGGQPVRSAHPQDLLAFPGHRAGDRVPVQVQRKGEMIDLTLILSPDPGNRDSYDWDFYPPVAFEGDLPILQSEHGCPVVGMEGKVVGVAVGRIQPHACVIVPADQVLARLTNLKAGKPLTTLPQTPTRPQPSAQAEKVFRTSPLR